MDPISSGVAKSTPVFRVRPNNILCRTKTCNEVRFSLSSDQSIQVLCSANLCTLIDPRQKERVAINFWPLQVRYAKQRTDLEASLKFFFNWSLFKPAWLDRIYLNQCEILIYTLVTRCDDTENALGHIAMDNKCNVGTCASDLTCMWSEWSAPGMCLTFGNTYLEQSIWFISVVNRALDYAVIQDHNFSFSCFHHP